MSKIEVPFELKGMDDAGNFEGYAAVFVTEKLFSACAETIEEFKGQPYPAIIPIPDNQGSRGLGEKMLRQNVEKAVGMDILSNN